MLPPSSSSSPIRLPLLLQVLPLFPPSLDPSSHAVHNKPPPFPPPTDSIPSSLNSFISPALLPHRSLFASLSPRHSLQRTSLHPRRSLKWWNFPRPLTASFPFPPLVHPTAPRSPLLSLFASSHLLSLFAPSSYPSTRHQPISAVIPLSHVRCPLWTPRLLLPSFPQSRGRCLRVPSSPYPPSELFTGPPKFVPHTCRTVLLPISNFTILSSGKVWNETRRLDLSSRVAAVKYRFSGRGKIHVAAPVETATCRVGFFLVPMGCGGFFAVSPSGSAMPVPRDDSARLAGAQVCPV